MAVTLFLPTRTRYFRDVATGAVGVGIASPAPRGQYRESHGAAMRVMVQRYECHSGFGSSSGPWASVVSSHQVVWCRLPSGSDGDEVG